jgi:hypothetical protein
MTNLHITHNYCLQINNCKQGDDAEAYIFNEYTFQIRIGSVTRLGPWNEEDELEDGRTAQGKNEVSHW